MHFGGVESSVEEVHFLQQMCSMFSVIHFVTCTFINGAVCPPACGCLRLPAPVCYEQLQTTCCRLHASQTMSKKRCNYLFGCKLRVRVSIFESSRFLVCIFVHDCPLRSHSLLFPRNWRLFSERERLQMFQMKPVEWKQQNIGCDNGIALLAAVQYSKTLDERVYVCVKYVDRIYQTDRLRIQRNRLKITAVKSVDNGVYSCRARSLAGLLAESKDAYLLNLPGWFVSFAPCSKLLFFLWLEWRSRCY